MQYTVTQNSPLTKTVYRLTLAGDTRAITRPGQFVQVAVPGYYLRRPLSVFDWYPAENGSLTLVYKTLGHGTEAMSRLLPGHTLDVLPGLGNGYDTLTNPDAAKANAPLLLGGGVGVPPLYGLAKQLLSQGKTPSAALGFNTQSEVILQADFEALGIPTWVATVDGTAGVKGFVTDAAQQAGAFDYAYACGPEPMLKAVYRLCDERRVSGQFSFEERMACGFGACMGCSCQTKYGSKRICKDGPVLTREEIVW